MNAPMIRLKAKDLLRLDAEVYEVTHRDGIALTLTSRERAGERCVLNHEDLYARYNRGEVTFLSASPNAESSRELPALESFSSRLQTVARYRMLYVQRCDHIFAAKKGDPAFSRRPETGYRAISSLVTTELKEHNPQQIAPIKPPSGSTLRNWHRRWEADRSITALIPAHHRRGSRKCRLDPLVISTIEAVVKRHWLRKERMTVTVIRELICHELNGRAPAPSLTAVRRWIANNIDAKTATRRRYGEAAADAMWRSISPGPVVEIPMREVEIDHTLLDLELVIDPGVVGDDGRLRGKQTRRAWLTLAIDAATRMIVGFHLDYEAPSYASVMQCLGMIIRPKDLSDIDCASEWPVVGVPDIVKLDNGPEFHSDSMVATAGTLGIELRYCKKGAAYLRGKVERFFGEVARDYCQMFPGRTYANIVEKADYPSHELAVMTLDEARRLFKLWVVDLYHNKEHSGLYNSTPLEAWRRLSCYGVRLPPKRIDMDALIGQILKRSVSQKGVHYLGLAYNSDDLQSARRSRAGLSRRDWQVRIDPQNIARILVLHPNDRRWFAVPLQTQIPNGILTLSDWRLMLSAAKARTPASEQIRLTTIYKARAQIVEGAQRLVHATDDEIWARQNKDNVVVDDLPRAAGNGQAGPSPQSEEKPAAKGELQNPVSHPTYGF